jgi:capsular polysaccharide transport system ATP-binding protein
MIVLHDASKLSKHGFVLRRADLISIPSHRRIALLGPSEADKRDLIDLLSGVRMLSTGHVRRYAALSFPVGHLGSQSRDLTVRQNVAHVARVYGADVAKTVAFVAAVLDNNPLFERPLREFPQEQLRTLLAIIALSIPFDTFLLADDVFLGGGRLKERCYALFRARIEKAGAIISARNAQFARQHCDMALFLHKGLLTAFEDVEEALSRLTHLRPKQPEE